MFAVELLANSAVASNCYIVLNMTSVVSFHVSYITWYYNKESHWLQVSATKILGD